MKNYAILVQNLENLLAESFESQNKSKAIKILKEIKGNTKLKFLYTLVENLTNGTVQPQEVDSFINENIKVAKRIDFSCFDKLVKSNSKKPENKLINAIGTVLFENKTIFNISDYNNAYEIVKNQLVDRNSVELNKKAQITEIKKSSITLDKEDRTLLESFINLSTDEDRQSFFKSLIGEGVTALDTHIGKTTDVNTKLKLYETKDMLHSLVFDENHVEKMVKVHELKKELLS